MRTVTANGVKRMEVGTFVWICKNGTDRRSEYIIVRYGKEKRLQHVMSGTASTPRPIKDRTGFHYEVEKKKER